MCFSAQASFGAAAILGFVGAATFAQKPEPRRIAFAAFPLVFALHQTIEGFVWLSIGDGPPPSWLTALYLFFAQVFWPVYTPLSVLLMEEEWRRRIGLWILLTAGVVVSATLAGVLVQSDYSVSVVNGSLQYSTGHHFEDRMIGLYLLAVVAPLILSRYRYVMAFGAVVLAGSAATHLAFYYAAASVWCYFAAIGSIFVFLHVRRRARLRRTTEQVLDR